MIDQIRQNLAGILLIIPHLGASIRMWKCKNSFYRSLYILLSLAFDSSSNVIYTAYSRNNPDFITDADFSVRSAVSSESARSCRGKFCNRTIIGVSKQISKSSPNIMCVNPASAADVLLCNTDWTAILDNLSISRNISQSKLVSLGNVLTESNLCTVHI